MDLGKLPPPLLQRLLGTLPADARVIVGPGIGRDAAAIDIGGGRALVAAADPVTFAQDRIGSYAVYVNANDVACLGARPAWFLATVLLPAGAEEAEAESVFKQIRSACAELEVIPVGGHIEVTAAVDHTVVAGTMLGEVEIASLVQPANARPGDHLLLTKHIAIEGTALLARDHAELLRERGVAVDVIDSAARLLDAPGISVVSDAQAAVRAGPPHAMHDPTEGGLATAILELAAAAGLRARVRLEDIPVLDETRTICAALGADPLGLLASGALLVAVEARHCDATLTAVREAGIRAACIGDLAAGQGAAIMDSGIETPLTAFARDELARILDTVT